MTEEPPVPRFWHPNFIKDYQRANPEAQVATLTWSPDEDAIIQQLVNAIESKAEIILSELLPDELPDRSLTTEHKYFTEHYVFVPPQFSFETKDSLSSPPKDAKPLLITNSSRTFEGDAGVHSKEKLAGIIKVIRKSGTIETMDLANEQIDFQAVAEEMTAASKVIVVTEHPQEVLAIQMIAAKMDKELYSMIGFIGSPFRYPVVGITPSIAPSIMDMSLRELILTAISIEKKASNIPFCHEALVSFTKVYSYENWNSACSKGSYQLFAKGIHAKVIPVGFWVDPWDYTTISSTETRERSESIGRFRRKAIHAFLQCELEKNDIKVELAFIEDLKEKLSSWFIERFLFKNNSIQWIDELQLCALEYKNWLKLCKTAILNWYQNNRRDASASRLSETMLRVALDQEAHQEVKERCLRKSIEFAGLDKQLSRLHASSKYNLQYFLSTSTGKTKKEFIDSYLLETSKQKQLPAIKRSFQLLPLFIEDDDIHSILTKLHDREGHTVCLYEDIVTGIVNCTKIQPNALIFDSNYLLEGKDKYEEILNFLDKIRGPDDPIAYFHLYLMLYFDTEKGMEMCQSEKDNLRKIIYTFLLFSLDHRSKSSELHDSLCINDLESPLERLFYIHNTAILGRVEQVRQEMNKFSTDHPEYFENPQKMHPGEHYYAMVIYSSLGMYGEAKSQMRFVESRFSSFSLWWKSVKLKLKEYSGIKLNS